MPSPIFRAEYVSEHFFCIMPYSADVLYFIDIRTFKLAHAFAVNSNGKGDKYSLVELPLSSLVYNSELPPRTKAGVHDLSPVPGRPGEGILCV